MGGVPNTFHDHSYVCDTAFNVEIVNAKQRNRFFIMDFCIDKIIFLVLDYIPYLNLGLIDKHIFYNSNFSYTFLSKTQLTLVKRMVRKNISGNIDINLRR